jgi:hypothetical protein
MQFVDKFHEMDPATEDLLFDGTLLRDGMVVLMGEPGMRSYIHDDMGPEALEDAKRFNVWYRISSVLMAGHNVIFQANYSNGIKKKINVRVTDSWLVKIDSIPSRIGSEEEQHGTTFRGMFSDPHISIQLAPESASTRQFDSPLYNEGGRRSRSDDRKLHEGPITSS